MFDSPSEGQVITLPASNFIVNAEIIKEKELPYLFRLKKSYELATGN